MGTWTFTRRPPPLAHQNQVSPNSDNINVSKRLHGGAWVSLSLFFRGVETLWYCLFWMSACATNKRLHSFITRECDRIRFDFGDRSLFHETFVLLTRLWSINRGYWSTWDPGGWFIYIRVPTASELMACGGFPCWKSYFLNSVNGHVVPSFVVTCS